jgi:FRG domain
MKSVIKKSIDNFTDFIKHIEEKKKELSNKSKYNFPLFRGHADGRWELSPTLLRSQKLKTTKKIFEQESAFFHDFITQAGHRIISKNSWHTLFSMRHHGVPTRLIDWTENLFVALYFALLDNKKLIKKPCIWIMDPYLLNRRSKKLTGGYIINPEFELKEYFDLFCKDFSIPTTSNEDVPEYPIAFYPFRHHDRLISQSGLFTMHGIDTSPIEKVVPECLIKIPIPFSIINDMRLVLEVAGFNKFSIYQDFDSLAKYLKDLYKFN